MYSMTIVSNTLNRGNLLKVNFVCPHLTDIDGNYMKRYVNLTIVIIFLCISNHVIYLKYIHFLLRVWDNMVRKK